MPICDAGRSDCKHLQQQELREATWAFWRISSASLGVLMCTWPLIIVSRSEPGQLGKLMGAAEGCIYRDAGYS